jgi:hypothetical protein
VLVVPVAQVAAESEERGPREEIEPAKNANQTRSFLDPHESSLPEEVDERVGVAGL